MSTFLAPFRSRFVPDLFEGFDRDMNRLFELSRGNGTRDASEWFNPTLNLSETETGYEVSLDLPGLTRDDINIEVKNGDLWITGERKHVSKTESPVATEGSTESSEGSTEVVTPARTWHRVESSFGMFRRMIHLGENVDAGNTAAEYKDGVLTISVPKTQAVQPQRIEISVK